MWRLKFSFGHVIVEVEGGELRGMVSLMVQMFQTIPMTDLSTIKSQFDLISRRIVHASI